MTTQEDNTKADPLTKGGELYEGEELLPQAEEITTETKKAENEGIKLYWTRWVMLGCYILLTMGNAILYVMNAPIANVMVVSYSQPVWLVNLYPLLYQLIFIPSSFALCTPIYNKFGLHFGLGVGAFLELICVWMKAMINHNFPLAMFAGCFGGLAEPFILNACAQVSANWFATDERAIATAMAVIAGPVGSGIGAMYSAAFVSTDDMHRATDPFTDPITKEILLAKLRSDVERCFFYYALILSGGFILIMLVMREKPKTPPSVAATIQVKELPLGKSFRYMFRNGNLLMLALSFGTFYASIMAVGQVISIILAPFGFSHWVAAILSAILGILGLTSAFAVGIILGKTHKYKLLYCIIATGSFLGMILFGASLQSRSDIVVYIVGAVFGIILDPILSIGYEYACELGYPVAPTAIDGLVLCSTNFIACLFIVASNIIFVDEHSDPLHVYLFLGIVVAFELVATILAFVIKEDLRRRKAESRRKSENAHEDEARRMRARSVSFAYECSCWC